MTYPLSPGYAKGSATSRAAADSLGDLSEMEKVILCNLYSLPKTVDEIKSDCEKVICRDFDRTTIGARVTELKEAGMVADTGTTRPTPRGRQATVWKLTIKGRDFVLNH